MKRRTIKTSLSEYKHRLLTILSKFNEGYLISSATIEIDRLFQESADDSEKINLVIQILEDDNFIEKEATKKEILKLYVNLVEATKNSIFPYIFKILSSLLRYMKEKPKRFHLTLASITGKVLESLFPISTATQAHNLFEKTYEMLLENFSKEQSEIQSVIAFALSKIIQGTPLEILLEFSEKVTQQLIEIFLLKTTKAKTQILECLLCYLLALEENFKIPNQELLLEVLNLSLKGKDYNCKKIGANFIYTLNIIKPFALEEFKIEIIKLLKIARYDNCKHVREAVRISLQSFNEIPESGIKSRTQTEEINESEGTPKNFKLKFRIDEKKISKNNSKISSPQFKTKENNFYCSTKRSVFLFITKNATEDEFDLNEKDCNAFTMNSNFKFPEKTVKKCEGCLLLEERVSEIERKHKDEINNLNKKIEEISKMFSKSKSENKQFEKQNFEIKNICIDSELNSYMNKHSNTNPIIESNPIQNERTNVKMRLENLDQLTYEKSNYYTSRLNTKNNICLKTVYSCERKASGEYISKYVQKENLDQTLEYISPNIKELLFKQKTTR